MEKSEMILGYAEYNDDKYPFVYENGILNLLPATVTEWEKQKFNFLEKLTHLSHFKRSHRWVENEYMHGTTNKDKNILFISKGGGSNNNGFIQYEVQIVYEYQSNTSNGDLIGGLIIKADEIDCFFSPDRVFEGKIYFKKNNNIPETISVQSTNDQRNNKYCGMYNSGDLFIEIELSAYPIYSSKSKTPLSGQSQMYFEFNKYVNLDKALEVVYQLESFLKYISYRSNINIKSIDVFRRNEDNLRSKEGTISILDSYIAETSEKRERQILTYELLEDKISDIFQSIEDAEVYLKHLPACINSKSVYDISRIILIFTAFEHEYKKFFPSDIVRSQKYFDLKKKVFDLLDKLKEDCNSKEKSYIDSFKTSINYNDTLLSSCIKNVIEKNIEIIEVFLRFDYQVYDNKSINKIAERLSRMRNKIAHGNLDLKIEPIHISDLKTLENLIYIMRLSSLGISKKSIQKGICRLIGYNIGI